MSVTVRDPFQPAEWLAAERRELTRRGVRIAWVVLATEPQQIGDRAIGEYLEEIEYVSRAQVGEWLGAANVNPWRRGSELSYRQREAIANQLRAFLKVCA